MLTRWLTFTAFLIGSVNPDRAAIGQDALTVAPTCRIKGHPEVELTLNCGDEKHAGVVKYWHTPYGDFHTPSFYSKLDPVFMHHDGSLVFPNSSRLHSGLYYCLQQHTDGATLWSYELHVGPNNQKNQEHGGYEGGSSCGALRFRRDVGSEEEKQAEVSYGQFAGAVVASVLLTFVLGFSAGALSRNHVLRCLETVTKRLQSLRQQQCQTDGSEVTMTTLPPMYDNRAQMEQMWDDDSTNCASMETTISSTASSPPAKPQRSFRHKREQEQEITAYLKGCDHVKEEEKRLEEEEEVRRSLEEKNKGCDGEAEEEEGENGASETETDEDKCSEDREKKDGRRESGEEEVEDDNRSKENGVETSSSEEEKWRDEKMGEEGWREERGGDDGEKKRSEEDEEEDISRDSKESSGDTEDETCGKKHGVERGEEGEEGGEGGEGGDGREGGEGRKGSEGGEGGEGGEASSSLLRQGRRSRVIRLYQYNEDGQRYCHLPDSAPGDTGPAPRLKQRSLSLTRLNAIMAAASAGPLDTSQRETEREEKQEKPHFHMEI